MSVKVAEVYMKKIQVIINQLGSSGLSEESLVAKKSIDPVYAKILSLNIQNDAQKGILSKIVEGENGQLVYLRDARQLNVDVISKQDTKNSHNYLIMGLNYTLALKSLLKSRGVKFSDEGINQLAQDFRDHALENIEGGSLPKVHGKFEKHLLNYIQSALAPVLVASGISSDRNKAITLLDKAKDWAAMFESPLSIATVDQIEGVTVTRYDTPQTKLTSELKDEYRDYQDSSWFKLLNEDEKGLFKFYQQKILGGRVIPSQLRTRIPGLKNSYLNQIWVEQNGSFECISDFNHCGSLAYLDKSTKVEAVEVARLTGLAVNQLQLNGSANSTLMITLNSELGDTILGAIEGINNFFKKKPVPYQGFDQRIVRETRGACRNRENAYSANICLNDFRYLESNDYFGVEAVVVEAQKLLDKSDLGTVVQKLETKITQLAERVGRKYTTEVEGVYIISLIRDICQILKKVKESDPVKFADLKTFDLWFGCASGENRTGVAEYHLQCEAVAEYLSAVSKKSIQTVLAASNHVQVMTGFQGGNLGMQGIREKSINSLPREYEDSNKSLLVTPYSDMKSLRDSIKAQEKKEILKAPSVFWQWVEWIKDKFNQIFGRFQVAKVYAEPEDSLWDDRKIAEDILHPKEKVETEQLVLESSVCEKPQIKKAIIPTIATAAAIFTFLATRNSALAHHVFLQAVTCGAVGVGSGVVGSLRHRLFGKKGVNASEAESFSEGKPRCRSGTV